MSRSFGFVSLLIVLAAGWYFYSGQLRSLTPGGVTPGSAVDIIGVRNDLTSMARAERRYWTINGKYASMEDLRRNGDIHVPVRETYTYSIDASDTSFKIVATYSGPDPKAPRRISVDETMTVKTEGRE